MTGSLSAVGGLAVFDDGSGPALYAGGHFTWAGGVPARNIAKWDGNRWWPLGDGVSAGSVIPYLQALTMFDDGSGPALFAGGSFSQPVHFMACWDGRSWSAVGEPLNQRVQVLHSFDDGRGPMLYAGGRFVRAGTLRVNLVARWDGAAWSNLGAGLGDARAGVFGVTTYDDGTGPGLFFGGNFQTAGNFAVPGVAKWGCVRGDLNCDGVLNGGDIDPFFLALSDPAAYQTAFPSCNIQLGDMNGDRRVNAADIDPFFICLGRGACP
ncbi:MAG: hypothetical protein IH986_15235 [Planctomycetes bacterium]|nr:hypothetical protein [Planctomycetota bacterium]